MVPRRQVMLGGVLGAVAAASAGAEPAAQRGGDLDVSPIVQALDRIRNTIQNQHDFVEIGLVRDAQKTFLRVNGKLPDFIEVGSDVWFGAHDWHIRWQQPLNLGRDAAGRYTLLLFQTLLILRVEMPGNYVGIPYDNK